MIRKKPSKASSKSRTAKKLAPRDSTKFIPNLKQLNEAAKDLPDPDLWPESTYQSPLEVSGKQRLIEFTLKPIHRGKSQTSRWIYQGKVLIRKRDT